MHEIILKKNHSGRIKYGHLWIFSNEIEQKPENVSDGDIVCVKTHDNRVAGYGFYNRLSLISCRLLDKTFNGDLRKYTEEKLQLAADFRNRVYPYRNSYRLVFSESDFLPGLIIDKYNNTFVLQVNSAGIEKNIDMVVSVLRERFNAKNVFTRNDFYLRKLEGLDESDRIYLGERAEEIISDGFASYLVNFNESQKTGFYFDQHDNRLYIHKISSGMTVLDGYCNSGSFGIHSLTAGAAKVTFVDTSEREINNVKENLRLNNITTETELIVSDMFVYLEQCIMSGKKFDLILLDPPSFAPGKKNVPSALKGYTKLARLALRCVSVNGYLVMSSCSHHISAQDFLESINKASVKCNVNIRLVHFSGASADHPVLLSMPETQYLKFAVFSV